MDKTRLVDLKKKILIRSSMLAISSLEEILGLNDYISADEALLEIIKKALREFEVTLPLMLEMRLNKGQMKTCYNMGDYDGWGWTDRNGWYEIKSNFTLFLDCIISEDQIVLVPVSTPYIRFPGSWPTAGEYQHVTEYRRPYIFLGDWWDPYQSFYLKGICSRPIIPDFAEDKSFNPDSKKGAIYWLNVEEGAQGNYFMDLCMVHVLDYIRQLKASVQLPNSPLEILSHVDIAYQELRARCDNYALQSSWYGQLVL